MTFEQVIRAAIPDADQGTVEQILWARTPFPAGRVTPQSLYRAASSFRRADAKGLALCEMCERIAVDDWHCEPCNEMRAQWAIEYAERHALQRSPAESSEAK